MKKGMKKVNGKSPFELKWGISAKELAEQEHIKPEAIYMRVRNFGTPFQRDPKPSMMELMYGKTTVELALELDCTTGCLLQRLKKYGDATWSETRQYHTGKIHSDKDWRDERRINRPQGWLHPNHPQYTWWRANMFELLFDHELTVNQATNVILLFAEHGARDFRDMWENHMPDGEQTEKWDEFIRVYNAMFQPNTELNRPKPKKSKLSLREFLAKETF